MSEGRVDRPIVVGIDGSDSALRAASWAADEAVRRGATVRLVNAVHVQISGYRGAAPLPIDYIDRLKLDAAVALDHARSEILARRPELTVEVAVLVAPPVPALIDESTGAQLVVLGSRGLGGFTGILVGSTAVALVAHGHCPVAVIRGDLSADGPVVVGVDGSPVSEAALATAFEEAALRGAELVAVHTWTECASDSAYATARQFIVDWDGIERRQVQLLADQLACWRTKYPDVPVRQIVARDRPVRCLLDAAAGARLLVVGSRGHGGFTGMLLGSTSQALVYHATCPLMVVPGRK
ncbi:MAG TPA: universal stress protein [Pseudonocardiaceae bacterium]|nr:universal stress protein [Pseudonocardiaceae bacterium]